VHGRKRIFGVIIAQRTRPLSANVVLHHWHELSQTLSWIEGPLQDEGKRGEREKEGREMEKKEGDGRDGRKHPLP